MSENKNHELVNSKLLSKEEIINLISSLRSEYELDPNNTNIVAREEYFPTSYNDKRKESTKERLNSIYKYYYLDKDPQVNTDATRAIENTINATLEKYDDKYKKFIGKIRVVILNRSEDLNAFATPDNSIFLTQKLINHLGTLDALMGVVFHEVSHIINEDFIDIDILEKDYVTKQVSKNFRQEIAADVEHTPRLLELTNLNPKGLREGHRKLEEYYKVNGGSIDYRLLSERQFQQQLLTTKQYFQNVANEFKPLPETFVQRYFPTNKEIYEKLLSGTKFETFKKILPEIIKKFNKLQLLEIFKSVTYLNKPKDIRIKEYQNDLILKKIFIDYFNKILTENNINSDERDYFLFSFCRNGASVEVIEKEIGKQKFNKFIENFSKFEGGEVNNTYNKCFKIIFGEKLNQEHETFKNKSRFLEKIDTIGSSISDSFFIELIENYYKFFMDSIDNNSTTSSVNSFKKEVALNQIAHIIFMRLRTSGLSTIQFPLKKINFINFIRQVKNLSFFPQIESRVKKMNKELKESPFDHIKFVGNTIHRTLIEDKIDTSFKKSVEVGKRKALKRINSLKRELLSFFNKEDIEIHIAKLEKLSGESLKNEFIKIVTLSRREKKDLKPLLEYVDRLAKKNPNFFESSNPETVSIFDYIMDGIKSTNKRKINPEINRGLSVFNMKLNILISCYREDSPDFYTNLELIIKELPFDASRLKPHQFFRLFSPLFLMKIVKSQHDFSNQIFLDFIVEEKSRKIKGQQGLYAFGMNIEDMTISETDKKIQVDKTKVTDFEKFEQVSVINKFLQKHFEKQLNTSSLKELYDQLLGSVEDFISINESFEVSRYGNMRSIIKQLFTHKTEDDQDIYNDEVLNILFFGSYRKKIIEILENEDANNLDLLNLSNIIELVFPNGNEKDVLLKNIFNKYLTSNAMYRDKVYFFYRNFERFDQDSINLLIEQIKVDNDKPGEFWNKWTLFYEQSKLILKEYKKGERKFARIYALDILTNNTSLKNFSIIDSIDSSKENSVKQSTLAAQIWNLIFSDNKLNEFVYDSESNVFHVSSKGRQKFISIKDLFAKLKGITAEQRYLLIRKELISDDGELSSLNKRESLAEKLIKSLAIENNFIKEFILSLTKQAEIGTEDRNVFVDIFSSIVYKKLFSSLDVNMIESNVPFYDLRDKSTREITSFGQFFKKGKKTTQLNIYRELGTFDTTVSFSNPKLLNKFINESEDSYNRLITILNEKFVSNEMKKEETEGLISGIPENIQYLITALENTTLGTRGLQITKQMKNFEQKIAERLSRSFDANEGMNKFEFMLALQSASDRDPILKDFLENRLVRIKRKLGKGSMAATYEADFVLDNSNKVSHSVLRCIKPGAEDEVKTLSKTLISALDKVLAKKKGILESRKDYQETIENAMLAKIVVKLATEWCLKDLGEQDYEINDDIFRQQVLKKYNEKKGFEIMFAPERIFTSSVSKDLILPEDVKQQLGFTKTGLNESWVRIEEKASGVSLREFLDDPNINEKLKTEVVNEVYEFNRFQYSTDLLDENGRTLVQSDPSIGNYLVEIKNNKPFIHVLDRGLMLEVDERKIKLVKLFIEGNEWEFLNLFIDEVVEYNKLNNERYRDLSTKEIEKIKSSLRTKITIKVMSKKIFRKETSPADYITLINQTLLDKKIEFPLNLQLIIKNTIGLEILKNSRINLQNNL